MPPTAAAPGSIVQVAALSREQQHAVGSKRSLLGAVFAFFSSAGEDRSVVRAARSLRRGSATSMHSELVVPEEIEAAADSALAPCCGSPEIQSQAAPAAAQRANSGSAPVLIGNPCQFTMSDPSHSSPKRTSSEPFAVEPASKIFSLGSTPTASLQPSPSHSPHITPRGRSESLGVWLRTAASPLSVSPQQLETEFVQRQTALRPAVNSHDPPNSSETLAPTDRRPPHPVPIGFPDLPVRLIRPPRPLSPPWSPRNVYSVGRSPAPQFDPQREHELQERARRGQAQAGHGDAGYFFA